MAIEKVMVPPASLAKVSPYHFSGTRGERDKAADCLADAAWYEAGNDPKGQRAVIQVVLNRMKHPAFPKTACGVVFEGAQRQTGCQFTFTCDGSLFSRHPGPRAWKQARKRAEAALDGAVDRDVSLATHYHADYVSPWWSGHLQQVSRVGPHIFYRWPGLFGVLARNPVGSAVVGVDPRTMQARDSSGEDAAASDVKAGAGQLAAATETPSIVLPFGNQTASPKDDVIFMVFESTKPSGRWAMEALRRCGSGAECRVVGYGDAAAVARNAALSAGQREKPLFMLIRDGSSGMVVALWDCTRIQRPERKQCLPQEPQAVLALMGGRDVS
ncbi:cell wall hydrolase [Novosphingobium malaysiense]|uniref:cell wall hydrolase n=1 Tax=Novosphingobium malaysiense TaxID=1348853 RepID=UPI0012E0A3F7|nr:cell wall hydrolase [Novosphingobium malaysiense]